MGDPSDLRLVPASVANTPIDWTLVPETSRKEILKWAHDWENDVTRPLPTTVADLANFFNESKFFGYFSPALCTLIMDISEFGLKAAPNQPVGPRFYMKYLEQVWFLLFKPGTRDCIMGNSHDLKRNYDDDLDEEWAAEEVTLAQEFDVKLEQDVLRGIADIVDITNKLGGWSASTLEEDLQTAQFIEAMNTLPFRHPARQALFTAVFKRYTQA